MSALSRRRTPRLAALLGLLFSCTLACASPSVGPVAPPDAATVQRARAVGLPAVDPAGKVAGPFAGPEGTLYYVGADARVLFFQPEQFVAYFGKVGPAGVTYTYALTLQGQFAVDASNTMQQVQVLPDDAMRWPHAEAVAQVLMGRLRQIRAGQAAPPSPGGAAVQAVRDQALYDTTQAILNNMGSEACTQYYDGVYYLGCW